MQQRPLARIPRDPFTHLKDVLGMSCQVLKLEEKKQHCTAEN